MVENQLRENRSIRYFMHLHHVQCKTLLIWTDKILGSQKIVYVREKRRKLLCVGQNSTLNIVTFLLNRVVSWEKSPIIVLSVSFSCELNDGQIERRGCTQLD